jgi:hypothetical protein
VNHRKAASDHTGMSGLGVRLSTNAIPGMASKQCRVVVKGQ